MVYIVIGHHCWGKGTTREKAFVNAKKNGGKDGVRSYTVYKVEDDSAYVDGLGGIVRAHSTPPPKFVAEFRNGKFLPHRTGPSTDSSWATR